MTPNPELMHVYGTDMYFLEKVGSLPRGVAAATGALWMGLAASDAHHVAQAQAEAEAMNQAFREAEAQRMASVIAGFKTASRAELQKTAEVAGALLAQTFVKEALTLPGTGTSRMMGALRTAEGVPTLGQRVRNFAAGPTQRMLAAGGGPATAAAPVAAAASKAAPGLGKPLLSAGLKGKLLGTAAVAGLGYAAFKGLQGVRDYASQPTQAQTWGQAGPRAKAGINEFGYPE